MKLIDYHMHSNFSWDSTSTLDEIAKKAKEMGHLEICFTQHFDPSGKNPWGVEMPEKKIPEYLRQIKEARKKYGLKIKFGVEVDYVKESEEKIRKALKKYDFDFVLGSIHYIEHPILEKIQEKIKIPFLDMKPKEKIIADYFEKMEDLIKSGLFDCIAHADVFRRFFYKTQGKVSFSEYRGYAKKIIKLLKKYDVGFEINSSGIWKLGETYPMKDFIELAYISGLRKIILGSDTHSVKKVSKDLDKVVYMLDKIGFKKVAVFDKRRVSYIPISKILK